VRLRDRAHTLDRLRPVEGTDDVRAQRDDGLTGKAPTPRSLKREHLAGKRAYQSASNPLATDSSRTRCHFTIMSCLLASSPSTSRPASTNCLRSSPPLSTATADAVRRATVLKGLPLDWVRDVSEDPKDTVLASFRAEFHYMASSSLMVDRLSAHGVEAALVGVDSLEAFLAHVATPRPTTMTADPRPNLHRTAR